MDNNNSLSDRLRRLDHHSSVASEFRVHTRNGAILSTIFIFVTTYLIYTELQYNLTPSVRDKVHVNATSPAGLEMEFEVTFPSVPCALVNVDANDPNGQTQSLHLDRKHRVWKHRIDANGNMIGHKSRFEMGNTFAHEDHIRDHAKDKGFKFLEEYDDNLNDDEEDDCGSCYGAGDDGECCNTCDDVKRAYQRKGWVFNDKIEVRQCRSEKTSEEEKGEGCNVHGIVALDSGGGNLHLAPGRGMENFGKQFMFENLAELIMQAFETFNVSHTVHKLRFGQEMPGHIHQLDGQERMIEDAYGMYQYYIQVVPTLYKFLNGTTIQTNQYSVTEHMRHVNPGSNRGLPGVFFFYEVSALHVEIEEYRKGWIHFFTSVCAVVGGVFSVLSMTDAYLFSRSIYADSDALGR